MDEHPVELTVHLKDDDSSYKQSFLLYETFSMHPDDSLIKNCLKEAKEKAKIIPTDIKIKTKMVVE